MGHGRNIRVDNVSMIIRANAQNYHGGRSRAKRNVYVMHGPLELEQQILSAAGRQIEEIAFSLAERIPAEKTGELMEIAARIQNCRIAV